MDEAQKAKFKKQEKYNEHAIAASTNGTLGKVSNSRQLLQP
jgi:hypothetical protein